MRKHFTQEQQEEIYLRDIYCQICGTLKNLDKPHHIFYGTHTPKGWIKGDDSNGIWNGAAICFYDHQGFHHTGRFHNGKSIKENREYLENLAEQRYENT